MFKRGKYLILGLGITGTAVADFLISQNCTFVAFEEFSRENFEIFQKKFSGKGDFYFQNLSPNILEQCLGVFVSPGVPLTQKWVQEAATKKIPVLSELEEASRFLQGSMIAVTGTNGKSTTVTLIDAMLKAGGFGSSLKGNIGSPLMTALAEPLKSFYVVEVSSYQLEMIQTFRPKISVNLNVTADHLDRYADMEAYAEAKARIFMNQKEDEAFIYNADDSYCLRMSRNALCRTYPFSLVNRFDEGAFVDKNDMVVRVKGREARYSLNDCALQGLHNQENMLASLLAATLAGVDEKNLRSTLKNFKALSHRVEPVGEFKGMKFYDDSKGTNVGAVVMALASFEGPVILILGGRDKGGDYSPLKSLIRAKVKDVIVLGEAKNVIATALEGIKPLHLVENMKQAVEKSYELGKPGDTVLLSPACSSFDQYKNYAERGNDFSKWVFHYEKIK